MKGSTKITRVAHSNAGPPDTKYLYYSHLEGVTQMGSLLPASIVKTHDSQNKQQ